MLYTGPVRPGSVVLLEDRGPMESGAAFQSTNWSIVLAARREGDPAPILDALLRRYVAPIYTYLRRSGRGREESADLTQEFVAQVVLGRGLIEQADPARDM